MKCPSKHPQEIEVWYILPAIRKELVVGLKEKGFSQKKIAGFLNVTEPAISQYTNNKRAKEINFDKKTKQFIKECAGKIKDGKSAFRQIQRISEYIRNSKARCEIHMRLEKGLYNCDICYRK